MKNMMSKVKSTALVALGALLPVAAHAQLAPPDGGDLIGIVTRVVNGFLTLVAIIAVIFIIIGGLQYITSAGDEKRSDTAKNTILYAVIGLIVIGLAWAIVRFVIMTVS